MGLDGVLRATSLNVESALEKRTTRDAIAHDAATASSGRLEVVDDDGDARLVQFVRLDGLPLFVTASIKRSSALAASSLAVRSYIMFGLAITAVIVVFGVLLMNLAGRLRKSGDQAQKAERRLIEAIETIPEGFVLFDLEDRLVTCNSAYREVYCTTADQIRPGVRFEELLRLGLERGQHRVPEEEQEHWLKTRLALHKAPSGPLEQVIDSAAGCGLRKGEPPTGASLAYGPTSRNSNKGRKHLRARRRSWKRPCKTWARRSRRLIAIESWSFGTAIVIGCSARLRNCSTPVSLLMRLFVITLTAADLAPAIRRTPFDEWSRTSMFGSRRAGLFPGTRGARSKLGLARPTRDGGAVYVFRDVSEREEYERRLGEAVLAAEAANKAKSEFLAMMSHEICTPMNAIIGMSSVLAERELGATEKRYVHVIAEAGEKLLIIIDDLLDLSRLEAGKLKLSESSFDIRDVVASAVEMANTSPQARSLSIIKEIDADAQPSLVADAGRINQIILNLVNNAVKYAQRGTVTIRVSCTSPDELISPPSVRRRRHGTRHP